jgi:hypothetical protein
VNRIEGVTVKLLYKPVGVMMGVLGGLVAGMAFKRVWRAVGREADAPKATDRDRGWTEIVLAAALEGAVFGGVRAIVDRAGATGYERATGTWPGKEHATEQAD